MRLFCREDHDAEICPPHRFDGGWQNNEEGAPGIIYCRWCGDVRAAAPPSIGPSPAEVAAAESSDTALD